MAADAELLLRTKALGVESTVAVDARAERVLVDDLHSHNVLGEVLCLANLVDLVANGNANDGDP